MNSRLFSCVLFFIVVLTGCQKSNSLAGEAGDLSGEWAVNTLSGENVTTHKMKLSFKANEELLAFDGCNYGSAGYTIGKGNKIQMDYPSFTYMYCNKYHGIFGSAIKGSKKFSIESDTLLLYNEEGETLLTVTKN